MSSNLSSGVAGAESRSEPGSALVYLARQPIFDSRRRVVAYELLFRSGPDNFFDFADQDVATSRVIDGSLTAFGLDSLVGTKKAFINITRRVLVEELYAVLPADQAVLELLEKIDPDPDVVGACRDLKRAGYTLALDDFVFEEQFVPLVGIADIIKIDFMATDRATSRSLVDRCKKNDLQFLAEKVETTEDFDEGRELGCTMFQGYFFCKPEMVTGRAVPAFKLNYLRFLNEVHRPDLQVDQLESIIRQEVSLSVKLLRYLNSAWFGWRYEVPSIRQGILLLGERPIRKWASLVALAGMGDDKPAELVVTALIRARFAELLGEGGGLGDRASDLFLVGLFSLLDALVDQPMPEVLKDLSVPDSVKRTLLGKQTELSKYLSLTVAYQRGSWDRAVAVADELGVSSDRLAQIYRQAIEWTDGVFRV